MTPALPFPTTLAPLRIAILAIVTCGTVPGLNAGDNQSQPLHGPQRQGAAYSLRLRHGLSVIAGLELVDQTGDFLLIRQRPDNRAGFESAATRVAA